MTKPLILLFLALCALLPALGRTQTSVTYLGRMPKELNLAFTKAAWDSLDVVNLYTADGRSHELICGFNPWYGESRSRIEYKNQYGLRVQQFSTDDFACLHLFNFLKAAFEGVSEEHPIKVKIDISNGKISLITLPSLDFYEATPATSLKEQTAQLP